MAGLLEGIRVIDALIDDDIRDKVKVRVSGGEITQEFADNGTQSGRLSRVAN